MHFYMQNHGVRLCFWLELKTNPNPALTLKYDGFVNSEDNSVFTTQPTVATAADENSALGVYGIVVYGGVATNYAITHVDSTLTVEKNTIAVTLAGLSQTYTGSGLAVTATPAVADISVVVTYADSAGAAVASPTNAGTYTVTLTVFNNGGSRTSTQDITIDQDDLSLLNNPIYNKLTGGTAGSGSKTWYIDSLSSGHMGVGPDPESALGPVPEWWAAGPEGKPGCGLYDDRYVFSIDAFRFDMITNGDVYVNNELAGNFPGAFENLGDFTAPFSDRLDESWLLTQGTEDVLSFSGDSFIGFYTGVHDYRILELTDSTMSLQYDHHAGGLHWYLLLKTE